MANLRLASPLQFDSIVDGPGIRTVIWTQGCPHACAGCHNPQTHDRCGGFLYDVKAVIQQLQHAELQTGLTLSGGEPFLQSMELIPVVKAARDRGWDIWAYSGFTYEELIQDDAQKGLLMLVDVLVDGPFIESQKDYRLTFKGSKNQRIIDVVQSLSRQKIIRSSYDDRNIALDQQGG